MCDAAKLDDLAAQGTCAVLAFPGTGRNETTIASAEATVALVCRLPNQAMGWLERPNQQHAPLLAWTKNSTTDLSGEATWMVSVANPI